jgi:hypothetical protein
MLLFVASFTKTFTLSKGELGRGRRRKKKRMIEVNSF